MRSNIIRVILNDSSGKGGSDPVKPESDWTIVHFVFDKKSVHVNAISFKDKESSKFYYVRSCNISSVASSSGYEFACPYGFANLEDFVVYGSSDADKKIPTLAETGDIDFSAKDPDGRPLMLSLNTADERNIYYYHNEVIYTFAASYNNPGAIEGVNHYASMYDYWVGINEIVNPDGTTSSGSFAIITAAINLPASKLDYMTLNVDYRSKWDSPPNWMLIQDQSSNIKDLYNNWKQTRIYKTDFSKDHLITSGRSFPFFYSATDNHGVSFI